MKLPRGRASHRRSHRVDGNHRALVFAFELRGASVTSTAGVGGGFPDAVIGFLGRNELVEFKTDTGKLRDGQTAFALAWRGRAPRVVRTVADVEAMLAEIRKAIPDHPAPGPAKGLGATQFRNLMLGEGRGRGGPKRGR